MGDLDDGWVEDDVGEDGMEEVTSERTGDPAALVELAVAEELPADELAILEAGADDEVVL